jgi:hypothetical protein
VQVHEVLRYPKGVSSDVAVVDGVPNFFHATRWIGNGTLPRVQLESGISTPSPLKSAPEGQRVPVILIRSNPHRSGTEITPWQDYFDTDRGHIRYYGDNKSGTGVDAAKRSGNARLLSQFELHHAPDANVRKTAAPLVFFRGIDFEGKEKGFLQFEGFGLVERAERVTEWDPRVKVSFTNYRFDFLVMSLDEENESFSWDWINARRDQAITLDQTLALAPLAWRRWLREGASALPHVRRSVSARLVKRRDEQRPEAGSKEEAGLKEIYDFYKLREERFEVLAELVAEEILGTTAQRYHRGWITPASGDGGADFIARMDVGSGFATAKLVVLGQAKCEKLGSATSGRDIARTVARLRRGWIGVYVTTSYFSSRAQQEVIDDEYPLVLVNGLQLVEVVSRIMYQRGVTDLRTFLDQVDATYEDRRAVRNPSEILMD